MNLPICSPLGLDEYKRSGSCLSHVALVELANSWNRLNPTKTAIDTTKDAEFLRKSLTSLLSAECGTGKAKELAWIQALGGMSQNKEAAKLVMPPKPRDWQKNPRKWLNNYDIQHVLSRMEGDAMYPYKLLGVFPIDFQGKDASGTPLYPEMHYSSFDLSKYVGKYKFLGLITNLDSHDGPGTHWTSSFIVIDPALKCFGAYYYDSTFGKRADLKRMPPEIKKFFKQLKKQAEALPEAKANKRKFKNVFYKLNHQQGNTECGMFSIFYQVYWLNNLIKNINTVHKDIVRLKINDNQVFKLRDFFFAPTKA